MAKEKNQNQIDIERKEEQKFLFKAQQFIEENSKVVIGVSIGVIVAVILFFVIKNAIAKTAIENENKASVNLSRVMQYYSIGDYQKALYGDSLAKVRGESIIGLVKIVDEYGGTESGKIAALYAGECFKELKKYVEAKEYYEIALKSKSNLVKEGANAGLGTICEYQGDYKEAIKYFEKASNLSDVVTSKDRYLFYAALNYEKIGEKEKAINIFKDIIGRNKSEFAGFSKSGLARLGTIIE